MAVKSDIVLKHLKEWRIERGMTQAQLALEAGVARAMIARADTGEGVSVRRPAKIAKALEISVHQLRNEEPGQSALTQYATRS